MKTTMMKTALITGASGGLGGAIAQNLALSGIRVFVHANHHLGKAHDLVQKIQAAGGQANAVSFDVCNALQTQEALQKILDEDLQGKAIDILVNNAGIHDDAAFPAMREHQWHAVLDVSLNGFFHVTQPLIMPMVRQRYGRIINISSVAALLGNRGQTNYAAAKGGLQAATKSLSLELASRGITVNAVAPGIIETSMSQADFDIQRIKQIVPMQRAGKPEEVAQLVAFLASDAAAYITGQTISINGGMA